MKQATETEEQRMEATITTVPSKNKIGVNRDGKPVGYASRIDSERWTAFVYIAEAPFDTPRGPFTADEAVEFIAVNGVTPAHLA